MQEERSYVKAIKAMLNFKFRFRHKFMIFGSILVVLGLILSDPDSPFIQDIAFGAGAVATVLILLKTVIHVTMAHLSRKALFDYIDFEEVAKICMQSPIGAGLLAISIGLFFLGISIIIFGVVS